MGNRKRSKPRLIISSYDNIRNPYYNGGGARVLDELVQRLSSFHTITVLTAHHPKSHNFRSGDVQYKHIGPRFAGPQLGQLLFHFLLPFYTMTQQFDLWIESFTPPHSTSCLQLFTKKPVIGLAHMLASEDMWRKYKLPFYILEHLGLKTYKFFITLTPNERKKIRKHNAHATIFTIPNGIDKKSLPTTLPPLQADPFILFIGRIEYNQKGLDLLLAAFESIGHKTTAKLVIAGSGKDKDVQMVRKAVDMSAYKDRISLVGEVSGTQKDHLFRTCTAVVQPSRYETFSVVALESLVYGKPLIGFDIEGLRWLPKECVLRASSFSTQEFGSLIHKTLTNKRIRKNLGSKGRAYSKQFAWPLVTQKYRAAINQVINTSL